MGAVEEGGREPMSRVDTAWLRMESPTNLMMITGVLVFSGRLDAAAFKALLAERFLAYRRFNQRAVDSATGAHWEHDPDFDLDWHVRPAVLPGAAGQSELERYAGELASTPLDHARPLWQFHLIEDYAGGSALIARLHHCYADGLALVQVLLSLTDAAPDARARDELARVWLRRDGGGVFQRLLAPAQAGLRRALALGGAAWEKAAQMWSDPAFAAELAREGSEITRELARALALPDDPPTALKVPLGVVKRVAWAAPIALDEVKAVGRALGCTVNDVLLAAAAGALRAHLLERGEDVDGVTVRATVPVNLRPLEHAKKLGNHFGLVFLELPIGEAHPLRRLQRIAACMNEMKGSRQALVSFGLLAALGMAPAALQRPALELFSRKASAVATNVPGPQMPLYLAGAEVRELMFWVPQTGSIGIGLSILSYNGRVHFGLIADARCMPDPIPVAQRFAVEFEKLALITLMEDWDGDLLAAASGAEIDRYDAVSGVSTEARSARSRRSRVKMKAPTSVSSASTTALKRKPRT